MTSEPRTPRRWRLADLIDFETALAAFTDDERAAERLLFARDIRPKLKQGSELGRRRLGLRLWLAARRAQADSAVATSPGEIWLQGTTLLRAALFFGMGAAGFALVAGLCVGTLQAVHVILFFALTLIVPWLVFVLFGVTGLVLGQRRICLERGLTLVTRLAERTRGRAGATAVEQWRDRLLDGRAPRQALSATLGGAFQLGGLGFNLGAIAALLGCLMVFDVRFYWEATPETGGLMQTTTALIATPWQWAWPAAVPDASAIEASRARYVDGAKQVPGGSSAAAAWWRFLLISLLIWGVLPRLLLVGLFAWRTRSALAALDFQAPRHRALWRALTTIERGAVAAQAEDGALVLDVGGIGVRGTDIRGFLLRTLRVNPQADHRVGVLDEATENDSDAALAASPEHVVLLVEDWNLSPRQAGALHARVRTAIGTQTPMTWVVMGLDGGVPVAPAADHLTRWTAFIDGLRDPATEIVAYGPGH